MQHVSFPHTWKNELRILSLIVLSEVDPTKITNTPFFRDWSQVACWHSRNVINFSCLKKLNPRSSFFFFFRRCDGDPQGKMWFFPGFAGRSCPETIFWLKIPERQNGSLGLKRSSRSWGNSIWATCKGSTGHECVKNTGLFGEFLLLNHWVVIMQLLFLLYCWNFYEPSSNRERRVERLYFFLPKGCVF